jgi:hypothetical protein
MLENLLTARYLSVASRMEDVSINLSRAELTALGALASRAAHRRMFVGDSETELSMKRFFDLARELFSRHGIRIGNSEENAEATRLLDSWREKSERTETVTLAPRELLRSASFLTKDGALDLALELGKDGVSACIQILENARDISEKIEKIMKQEDLAGVTQPAGRA